MKRGDVITVRLHSGQEVERTVWQVEKGWVMACRREVYDDAIKRGLEEPPGWMGFEFSDIVSNVPERIAA